MPVKYPLEIARENIIFSLSLSLSLSLSPQAFIAHEVENQTKFGSKLKQATDVFDQCLRDYAPEQICLAFNGGKDCTALLHFYAAFLDMKRKENEKEGENSTERKTGFKAMYIRKGNPFPEVEKFVEEMVKEFDLQLITVVGSIKEG